MPSNVRCGGWSGWFRTPRAGHPAPRHRWWQQVGRIRARPCPARAAVAGGRIRRPGGQPQPCDGARPDDLTLLSGAVRTVTGEHRLSRVRLGGRPRGGAALAVALAGEVRLAVPRAQPGRRGVRGRLWQDAATAARGRARICRPGCRCAEAFAHVVGHLTDVVLHFAPTAADGREGPEPVHQMRVAVRRLRSAIKVFRRAVSSPAVDAADAGLKALAAKLAPTRDWDVFVTETATSVAACVSHRAAAAAAARRGGAPAARVSQRTARLPGQRRIPAAWDRACLPRRCAGLAGDRR